MEGCSPLSTKVSHTKRMTIHAKSSKLVTSGKKPVMADAYFCFVWPRTIKAEMFLSNLLISSNLKVNKERKSWKKELSRYWRWGLSVASSPIS